MPGWDLVIYADVIQGAVADDRSSQVCSPGCDCDKTIAVRVNNGHLVFASAHDLANQRDVVRARSPWAK